MFHVKHCDTYLNNEGIERMAAKFQFESTVITTLASQYDVIIIGSGSSGLVSAAQAHELGLKPVILEKMRKIGGNSIAEAVVFGRQAGQQVFIGIV